MSYFFLPAIVGVIAGVWIAERILRIIAIHRLGECLGVVQRILTIYVGVTPTTPAEYREGLFKLIEER